MKKQILFIAILITMANSFCQSKKEVQALNLDFEKTANGKPLFWVESGNPKFSIAIDSVIRHSGKYAASIQSIGDSSGFKALGLIIPDNYAGQKITLSGYIKTENVREGWAGLWVRIDPSIAFDNMKKNGVTGTTEWKKYTITLDLNPVKTRQIVIGALLFGKGKMWVDDLELSIDGKPISELKPLPKLKSQTDTMFNQGSAINSIPPDADRMGNLYKLGLVWGFLKYYHPAVTAGNYNWDYELFRIMPQLLNERNPQVIDAILVKWIKGLGNIESVAKPLNTGNKIIMQPDTGWIVGSKLSPELSALLMKVKTAKRDSLSYYIGLTNLGNPEFKNESSYPSMLYPDAGFRMLSLFRYWNMIQYYFPYKYLIGEDWKRVLKEFIPKFIKDSSATAYDLTLLELIARVHDTHANIWGGAPDLAKFWGINSVPVELSSVEDKFVVTGFAVDSTSKITGLKKGDIIFAVNHQSVEKILQNHLKYLPASNYSTQLRDFEAKLLRTNDTAIVITFIRDKKKQEITIAAKPVTKIKFNNPFHLKDTCFKMIGNDIGYLYPGSVKNSYLPAIMEQVKSTCKGLIIDLRCYPSEFIVFTLGKYLMPGSTPFVKFSQGNIAAPGLFTVSSNLSIGDFNADYYKGKIVILVNEITQSQAEYTTMAFRVVPHGFVIGSTTAGADGNVSAIMLPGGISTMISGLGVYYPNGTETQRKGIVPDLFIRPSVQDIRKNKDVLIDKAIEIINQ